MPHDTAPSEPIWLEPDDPFPPVTLAWNADSWAPGLLASSQTLNADRLVQAYQQGIFPWYSPGQPVLWWSPDPRMVLDSQAFRFRRSLQQSLRRWTARPGTELVFDRAFSEVITRCARQPRPGQTGTWIVPAIVQAYTELHRRGLAHSAEIWQDGQLVAGLYFVALGHALFGESMFTTVSDGSKMALCLLVSVARHHGIRLIDCQQNTRHLASLGACEMPRADFLAQIHSSRQRPPIDWAGETLYWRELSSETP